MKISHKPQKFPWSDWLDTVALSAWGILFPRYWLNGKLGLLIHPNYFGLSIAAGITLLLLAGLSGWRLVKGQKGPMIRHATLAPPKIMALILLAAALVGLLITPRPFASDTALQRGLLDTNIVTRVKPQAFRVGKSAQSRSLIDWIRTLDVYPEPDAYMNQPVSIQGFAVHPRTLSDNYLTLTRFVITCCAADVYPIGLPVKLDQNRQQYQPDQWFEVKGKMITESLNDRRTLVVQANSIVPIPEPKNPYEY